MSEAVEMNKRFAAWTVGGEEYKLKLGTGAIVSLEEQFGCNLIEIIRKPGLPKLKDMLAVTHRAAKTFKKDLTLQDTYDLYDTYEAEGGSQSDFYVNVFQEIYRVSGFFTKQQIEMADQMAQKAQERM